MELGVINSKSPLCLDDDVQYSLITLLLFSDNADMARLMIFLLFLLQLAIGENYLNDAQPKIGIDFLVERIKSKPDQAPQLVDLSTVDRPHVQINRIKKIMLGKEGTREMMIELGTNQFSIITNVDHVITVEWTAASDARSTCLEKRQDKRSELKVCENHIVLIEKTAKDTLLVCGTHATKARCRYYKIEQDDKTRKAKRVVNLEEIDGQEFNIPESPEQPFYSLFLEPRAKNEPKHLLIGARDKLARFDLRSKTQGAYHESIANSFADEVQIIDMIARDEKVYIFFTEQIESESTDATGQVVKKQQLVSRVATLCRGDQGDNLDHKLTTFVKTTIDCPLEDGFSFSELTGVSAPFPVNDDKGEHDVIAATFVRRGGIPGSAVCAFRFTDIDRTLQGDFVKQARSTGRPPWAPKEHPAMCDAAHLASGDGLRETMSFLKANTPLVMGSIVPLDGVPLLTRTLIRDFVNAIKVQPPRHHNGTLPDKTLMFIATDKAKVLRASISLYPKGEMTVNGRVELISEQDISIESKCESKTISEIALDGNENVYAVMPGCLVKMPLTICSLLNCQKECESAGDPNCYFDAGSCHVPRPEQAAFLDAKSTIHVSKFNNCPTTPVKPIDTTTTTTTTVKSTKITTTSLPVDQQSKMGESVRPEDVQQASFFGDNKILWIVVGALLTGFFIGAFSFYFFKKCCQPGNDGDKSFAYQNENGETDPLKLFTATSAAGDNSRIDSIYMNEGVQLGTGAAAPRIQSTGSDSSGDSGIGRASGDHTNAHIYNPHLFDSATTGRPQRPKTLNIQPNYNTVGNHRNSHHKSQFGTMHYQTTASSNGLDEIHTRVPQVQQFNTTSKQRIRLGSSSLQQYSTLQTSQRRDVYVRQQSAPTQRQVICPIVTIRLLGRGRCASN